MIKTCDFENLESDYIYARAPHTRANARYDGTVNGALENKHNESIGEHDYISLISKDKYTEGTEVDISCYFEGTGAPCIVFTDELVECGEMPEYRLHFEVCIYKGGVNVWHILHNPERVHRPIKPTRIYFEEWEVNKDGVDCRVKFGSKSITVFIEGREFTVTHEDFPETFRVGFTACEGPCGFRAFSVKA